MEEVRLNALLIQLKPKEQSSLKYIQQPEGQTSSAALSQELPFTFNVSDFLPSKDPLATDIVSECVAFNRKVKIAREELKQTQFEW
jgi:hypothetical protein